MMRCKEVVAELKSLAKPGAVEGMARFGITARNTLGVSMPDMRRLAKKAGKSHELAGELWDTGIHEARIVAGIVDVPGEVTPEQMDSWAADFDSWDVCDQVCMNLFDKTPFAYDKCLEWSAREEEYVKRAGFALMACLAWHDKGAPDRAFKPFFAVITRESTDERNFVKKAVNWALRQIGKRNASLNRQAIATSEKILKIDSKSARWIARDALRELTGEAVQNRLKPE